MPQAKLTPAFCEDVRPVEGRQVSYLDKDTKGLELRVSGDGRKSWSFRYRTREGRQARVTLGVYSTAFGVKEARAAARKTQVLVDEGGDPAMSRRVAKLEASTEHLKTFGELAAAYFRATEAGRYRPKRASSLKHERMVYRVHVEGPLADIPIDMLSRRTIKSVLERMLDKGVTSQAVKAQAIIRQMLTYAVNEERIPFNFIANMAPVAPENVRMRVYTDAEIEAIWSGVAEPESLIIPDAVAEKRREGSLVQIGQPMRIAIQLVFLLLQRRNEVLGMARSELDLEHGVWTIPAARMKSKRTHIVPLPPWAVSLIEQAIQLNDGLKTDQVFPSRVDASRSMNGPSMNVALTAVLRACGIEDGTIHDIRRIGSTLMTSERLNIPPFIRSKVLGHYDAGGGAQVSMQRYDANTYVREKRAALAQWQQLLARIVGERAEPVLRFDGTSAIAGAFAVASPTSAEPEPKVGHERLELNGSNSDFRSAGSAYGCLPRG